MDYQLDAPPRSSALYSCSIITALDDNSSNSIDTWSTEQQFISLRCHPTLTTLPPELLSKISYYLSLCDYSFLSRTCSRLHSHLFHPAELVLFLKTRYRLSIQSGSIIIFAYLANMQVRAPLLLERIFEDFFADSPLRLQEEQKWKQQCQQQRQQLSNNTFHLNQDILSKVNSSGSSSAYSIDNSTSLEYQRMDALEVHKMAEKARRQAKWDAVRMLGVLYALDKTHIGPSSSTNALVLSGACDPPEPTPLAPTPATATRTETQTENEAEAGQASAAIVPTSALAPAPSPQSSHPTTTTTTTANIHTDEYIAPSSMYHISSSPMPACGGPGVTVGSAAAATPGRDDQARGPSPISPSPSTIATSFPPTPTSLVPTLSSSSSVPVQEEELRQRLADRRNKRHMFLRAAVKERATDDEDVMEYVEYQSARSSLSSSSRDRARRGCWTAVNQDFDFDTEMIPCSLQQHEREREHNRSLYDYSGESEDAFDRAEEDEAPMNVNAGYGGSTVSNADKYMHSDSTTPARPAASKTKFSSSSACPPPKSSSITLTNYGLADNDSLSTSALSLLPDCSSVASDNRNRPVLREDKSAFASTPLGICVPVVEANTNISGNDGSKRWLGSGIGCIRGGSGSAISKGNPQAQQQQPLPRTVSATTATTPISNSSTSAVTPAATTANTGTQQKMQQILNRHDKIAFLTKYTDRMHLKLQALGIEDWGQGDIQRKKTYQLMIQHNDKTGEKDLVKFYLGRYGGSVTSNTTDATASAAGDAGVDADVEPVVGAGFSGLQLQQEPLSRQGTPLVVQA
ncbi:hypothetical protein EC991_002894 [Linnemannia zychae]|nr:hypothetical protein EC991_002894 [Linnemannia zychae]